MSDQSFSPTGLRPSVLHLPRGEWRTVLDCLCARFPAISREQWLDRMARGRVVDEFGAAVSASRPHREGLRVFYFREVADEKPIPFVESILHIDEHLLVVDKPHFLPVMPAGAYVEHTLLSRLIQRFDNPQLVPLHRIDRHTAGLVMFSARRATRAAYRSLFDRRGIEKVYEAIAPALPHVNFPQVRATRLATAERFFCMREIDGLANTETRIEVRERRGELWRYALYPITGKKHQLRVHMAALGAPICNDPLYPLRDGERADDYAKPLQLLAQSLTFIDPLSGAQRRFESQLGLSG